MTLRKLLLIVFVGFVVISSANGQLIGFRIAANSNVFLSELGTSDVPHPVAFQYTPALSSDTYTPQLTAGFEGEILFQASPMSLFGVELEYSKLKGYNDNPPFYNYYLTPYFEQFQDAEEFINNYINTPVNFNTTLFNVAVNWKYFFFRNSSFKPFIKLTGVVAFVGTDYTFKEHPYILQMVGGYDPETNIAWDGLQEIEPKWDVLYARGTSNSDREKWPAFHLGGGIGFDYQFSEHWSFQIDATSTIINSDIINGAPNFTYLNEEGEDVLKYQKHASLSLQLSAGLVYYIEVKSRRREGQGKTDPNLPFYLKKR